VSIALEDEIASLPALKHAGGHRRQKIDVVVVYKVDRLTRSLADFAQIIQVFDSRT
jgi:site-specific DNA recombinase